MGTQIDQEIPELPIPPYKNVDSGATFVTKAETFRQALKDVFEPAMNYVINKINIISNEVSANTIIAENSANIATAAANYKGNWVAGYNTIGYSVGMSVKFTDGFNYISNINNNLVSPVSKTNTTEWGWIEKYENLNGYDEKTTPIDADEIMIADSVSAFSLKKLTWVNIKATLALLFILKVNTPTTNALGKIDDNGNIVNSNIINDANGNIGIGVTPSAWNSNIKVNQIGKQTAIWNDSNKNLTGISKNVYKSGASTYNYIVGDYAQMYIQGTGSHQWYTAPSGTAGNEITWTNAMTLDASGNLLLGISGGTGVIQATSAIYSWDNVSNFTYIINQTVSGTAQVFGANVGGVVAAAILSNGTYQSATNVYGSTSDAKLKENIVDTSPKLDKLMQVQVRNFNYIGQEDSKQIGVIAQEIEQIFPSVVFETKDTKQVEVTKERIIPALEELKDDDGNITQEAKPETIEEYTEIETVETGETTKNVKYSVIYMMMLKGMQEMREEYIAEIKSLKDELAVLKGAK